MAILITVFACFIASLLFDKKVFPTIYAKTSINPFNFIQKVLSFAFTLSLIAYIPGMNDTVPGILVGCIIAEAVIVVLFVLLNLKFKKPKYIVLVTILQIVFSMAFVARLLVWFLLLALNFGGVALGQDWSLGSGFSLFGGFKPKKVETVEGSDIVNKVNEEGKKNADSVAASAEAEKERSNEAADAVAARHGFSSAEEAEEHGIKTGKKQ